MSPIDARRPPRPARHRADGADGCAARQHAAVARRGRPVPVPGARDHDLDAVRARAQPAARARRAAVVRPWRVLRHRRLCVRPAAAARGRGPVARPRAAPCSPRRWPVRWWPRSSRTGAASTTRCSPSRSARCSGSSPSSGIRVTGGEDGLLNIKRRRSSRARSLQQRGAVLFRARPVRAGARRAVAAGAFAVRPRAARDQAERNARRLRRPQRLAVQVAGLRRLGRRRGAGRRAVRAGAAVGLPERDEPAQLGLRRDDGADRRRARQLLGAGDRRAVLHPRARPARRLHRDVAAVVRPRLHGDGAVPARRRRRRVAGVAAPRGGASQRAGRVGSG